MPQSRNRLGGEQSPYLLQHAHNPVNWFPWGPEAFATARAENKPLFLSIGYATCHWCHVMERECFEDPQVAERINACTVPVKIDREERPDLDAVYMAACQLMTGSGGWPLSVFADHRGRPFFSATYIPKASGFGRKGLLDLLPAIQQAWIDRPDEVERAAANVHQGLVQARGDSSPPTDLGTDVLDEAVHQLAQRFDPRFGGFGGAPKFPSPHMLLFLLRRADRTGDPQPLHMAVKTLTAMRLGGLFDHVGLGFHRYSTDERWLLPHFEKMLYDQAMLALAYTEAWRATADPLFERTAREVLAGVQRDLAGSEGAFHSARDADSEGEEGRYYLWTVDEVRTVLPPGEAELYCALYNLTPQGNFAHEGVGRPDGTNIPHLTARLADSARELGLDPDTLRERMEAARLRLLAVRDGRVAPLTDDKILTDWNGLAIAALARAATVFGDASLARAAGRAADFLLTGLRDASGRLLHRYRNGQAAIPAFLDDHAFLAWGLLELGAYAPDPARTAAALELTEALLARHLDRERGGFFLTADDAEPLLVRPKDFIDAALPSGNSVALMNLVRLSRLTGRADLAEHARRLVRCQGDVIRRHPTAFAMLLCGVDMLLESA